MGRPSKVMFSGKLSRRHRARAASSLGGLGFLAIHSVLSKTWHTKELPLPNVLSQIDE